MMRFLFMQIVERQPEPLYKQRLTEAFHKLIPDGSQLLADRSHQRQFVKTLESVIADIRGILCVK